MLSHPIGGKIDIVKNKAYQNTPINSSNIELNLSNNGFSLSIPDPLFHLPTKFFK